MIPATWKLRSLPTSASGYVDHAILVGDYVQLWFVPTQEITTGLPPELGTFGGERMWVEVWRDRGDGAYQGRLRSNPLLIPMSRGDIVDFSRIYILQCRRSPLWFRGLVRSIAFADENTNRVFHHFETSH